VAKYINRMIKEPREVFYMYFVMYCQAEEIICENIDQVMEKVAAGWKLYGYSDTKQLAQSLLHECKHY
jgi:hypothetical protein